MKSHGGDEILEHMWYTLLIYVMWYTLSSLDVRWVVICTDGHCQYWFHVNLISEKKIIASNFLKSLKSSETLSKSTVDIIKVSNSSITNKQNKNKNKTYNMASETYFFPTLSLALLWFFYNSCPLKERSLFDKESLIRQLEFLGKCWPK